MYTKLIRIILITFIGSAIASTAFAQDNTEISGVVVDATNQTSLPGVNIVLKGTTQGTTTDADGRYSITVTSLTDTLVFSFIGYQTLEVPIKGRTEINVDLVRQLLEGDELVVIGYGTSKRKDLTGSITSVDEESFNQGIAVAPEQLLQGKATGVNISLNSGRPGANSTVRIRGGTSISASNAPLYVVDGVPIGGFSAAPFERGNADRLNRSANNPLNFLNPGDIKSIDILKDASATAIYGSRGANGVILITTKKGESSTLKVEYSTYLGVSSVRNKLDVLSADQFRNFLNENSETIGDFQDGGTSTDWQDEIFRTAISHSNEVAISNGNEQTSYRASVNFMSQEGVIISSKLKKLSSNLNINHSSSNDKLGIDLNLTNTFLDNDNTPNTNSAGGDTEGGIIRDALRFNPTFPVRNDEGDFTFLSDFNLNPVEQARRLQDETETFRSLNNLKADYQVTDWFAVNTNVGFTFETTDRNYFAPKESQLGSRVNGQASQEKRKNTSSLFETNLEFKNDFNRHSFNFITGYSWQRFEFTDSFLRASDFITDLTSFNNIDGAKDFQDPQTGKTSNKLISAFGRLNYDFDDKYLFTFSLRRDGSSRFGENERWGLFPSAALAWRLSDENFMSDINSLSNLKVRVGYGITGNQEIGNFRAVPTLSAGSNRYIIGGEVVTAVGANQLSNPNLKWEETKQVNAGIDFGFLNQRLTGKFDYYHKKTEDLLLSFQVPNPSEVNNIVANVGELKNEGVEVELNGTLIDNNNFNLNVFTNYSNNNNNIITLSNQTFKQDRIITGGTGVPGFTNVETEIIVPGKPLGSFYGFEFIGVDENGQEQFRDLNGDGQITPGEDRKVIGNSQPDFFYGFGTRGNYKRFNFDIFLRGESGREVFNATALDVQRKTNLPGFNTTEQALNSEVAFGEPQTFSSRWVQDASFLRLENITIGYTFDTNFDWMNNLNVYMTGQNLFVITDYNGFDPEVGARDGYTFPRSRTVIFGLRLQM